MDFERELMLKYAIDWSAAEKHPLLTGMTAEAAVFLHVAVSAVMRNDVQTALDEVIRLSENEVPAEHAESYIMFAQYLCASVEYTEGWLFFKKLWVQFLLDGKKYDEARTALDELNQMIPEDADVIGLHQKHALSLWNETPTLRYRSCNLINAFFININGNILNPEQNYFALCCENIADIPATTFGKSPQESIERIVEVRIEALLEELTNTPDEKRVYSKGCLSCANYQLGEWQRNDKILYVNFSMYPAPCQCKCFYCECRKNGSLDFSKSHEVEAAYNHMFDMLRHAKNIGLIAPNATYQVSSGEITVHPYKDRILEFTKNQPAFFFTNCFIFDEQIAQNLASNPKSFINLSIDAGTAETWYKVKGVDNFNKVLMNLESYNNRSARKGQITLKYIILPGVNDTDEDFASVIEIMKRLTVPSMELARDTGEKYSQDDEANEKLMQSAVRLATLLHSNNLKIGMFTFTPEERERVIASVQKNA